MPNKIHQLSDLRYFAVVGSFFHLSRHTKKIVRGLLKKGKSVYPVDPAGGRIMGLNCYTSIEDIKGKIDVVNIAVEGKNTLQVIIQAIDKGVKRIWVQPKAKCDKSIKYCLKHGIEIRYDTCLIKSLRKN